MVASRRQTAAKLLIATSATSEDPYFPLALNVQTFEIGGPVSSDTRNLAAALESEARCCHCDADFTASPSLLRQAYLGAPFYVANAVPTVLVAAATVALMIAEAGGKSPDELPGRGRKLITFTDSRQGTAHMAVRMQQEAERSRLRGLVFELLRNGQAKLDAGPKDELTGDPDEIMKQARQLEALGMKDMAATLILKLREVKSGVTTRSVSEIAWPDMVSDLATSNDIAQSILDYNKYANPELFGGSEAAGPIARKLLLAQEISRRPKNQNSTETLALVRIGYQGLAKINSAPPMFLQRKPGPLSGASRDVNLTLQDWKDFLKVALDFTSARTPPFHSPRPDYAAINGQTLHLEAIDGAEVGGRRKQHDQEMAASPQHHCEPARQAAGAWLQSGPYPSRRPGHHQSSAGAGLACADRSEDPRAVRGEVRT